MAALLPARGRDLVVPLGVAFTDGPSGLPVLDGLSVWAWPEGNEARRAVAVVNPAGVAWFGRLAGLTVDPAAPPAGPVRAFVVEVRDALGRFLPGRVRAVAPTQGAVSVALRSAPGRRVPLGGLAFRAELWDAANDRPAAFALVTVKLAGNGGTTLADGLSDAAGRWRAVADWPRPKPPLAAPAPDAPPARWDDPRPLVLEVRYDPAGPADVPRLDRLTVPPPGRVWNRRGPDELYVPPDLVAAGPSPFRSAGDSSGRLLMTST